MACSGPSSDAENDGLSWWPAARPIGVYPVDDPGTKRLWNKQPDTARIAQL